MSYFPMCVDLTNQNVYLVGSGRQIAEKAEKLAPFGANLMQKDNFTQQDAETLPALVIVGDEAPAEEIFALCRRYRIPVNTVDRPALCTFFFPALARQGDLTVSVSTGGKSPGFAGCLRQALEEVIPGRSGEILRWLEGLRVEIKAAHSPSDSRRILQRATRQSFALGRPLVPEEMEAILAEETPV